MAVIAARHFFCFIPARAGPAAGHAGRHGQPGFRLAPDPQANRRVLLTEPRYGTAQADAQPGGHSAPPAIPYSFTYTC